MNEVRIDKWMWATRIFKTRTIAAEACKKNRDDDKRSQCKTFPYDQSRRSDSGTQATYHLFLQGTRFNRTSYGEQNWYPIIWKNVTTPDQYELLEMSKISGFIDRARGTGRPTKKDRRNLEEFTTPEFMDDFDFEF